MNLLFKYTKNLIKGIFIKYIIDNIKKKVSNQSNYYYMKKNIINKNYRN